MKENFQNFWQELSQTLQNYWQGFIHALPRLGLAVIILFIVFFLAGRIGKLLSKKLAGKAHDTLFSRFVVKLTKIAFIIAGIIVVMQILGLTGMAGGLLAGAGLSALIIGFAFKDIAENFLAGIILAFNRPFSLGDAVKIQEDQGYVRSLNFRTTLLKTFDDRDVFIPNALVLREVVTNYTREGILRLDFVVGIAYEDDIGAATELILQTVNENDIYKEKQAFVTTEELATNAVNLRVYFWTKTIEDYKKGVLLTKSYVIQSVKEALMKNGFTLPTNIVEMKLYDKRSSLPIELIKPNQQQKE